MTVISKATDFYRHPNQYTKADDIVVINDAKSDRIKGILIPEKLVEEYRYIIDEAMERSIVNSFKVPVDDEIVEAFGEDLPK